MTKKNTGASVVAGKMTGLEVNTEKTKCIFMSCEQTAGRNQNI